MITKLILDTDIGTDVDDAWALALCAASPEIDLLGITLVHADLAIRAKIARKMLCLAGREDIPVYAGLSEPLTPGAPIFWKGHEGAETDFSDIGDFRAHPGAVEFILEQVTMHTGEIVIAAIGPLTNIAEALRREPGIMRQVKRLVIMCSNYMGEGTDKAAREHNASLDPQATGIVFESGLPITVVGLNVTTKSVIGRQDFEPLVSTGFGRYLAAMTDQYLKITHRQFTFMHDPLAVAVLIDPGLVETQRMRAEALDDGRVAYSRNPDGNLDVGVSVNADNFVELLLTRLRAYNA